MHYRSIGDSGANWSDRFMAYIAMTRRTQLGNRTSWFTEKQWPLKLQPQHRRMVTVNCTTAYSFLLCHVHMQTEYVQQQGSTDIQLSHLYYIVRIYTSRSSGYMIHTSHFLILPCGVASRFCNEAIQTTLLELGFRHNPDILCLHIPPTDYVL